MYHARLIKGKISHRDAFSQRASVYGWPFLTASKSLPFLCKPAWPVSLPQPETGYDYNEKTLSAEKELWGSVLVYLSLF